MLWRLEGGEKGRKVLFYHFLLNRQWRSVIHYPALMHRVGGRSVSVIRSRTDGQVREYTMSKDPPGFLLPITPGKRRQGRGCPPFRWGGQV